MATKRDYTAEAVEAAKAVLLEIPLILGEYYDDVVLVGGWIPAFLAPASTEPHIGSMDIDLALDHKRLQQAGYQTILNLLLNSGYRQGEQPFIFMREVKIGGRVFQVEVDLLAGEYSGTSPQHRHQPVQDIQARKAKGCDLAFDMNHQVTIEGRLPDGPLLKRNIKIAGIVPFIVMKGYAIVSRSKEKDAYDIYWCLRNFPGGIDAIVADFLPHLSSTLVTRALSNMADHFNSTEHLGPRQVADFYGAQISEEREILIRDAYERVRHFLTQLGVIR
jgi:hypothetical protein